MRIPYEEIVQPGALYDGFTILNDKYLMFPQENELLFFMDFSGWKNIPDDRYWLPCKEKFDAFKKTDYIWFIADGYGVLSQNEYQEKGSYGSGAICVNIAAFPENVKNWIKNKVL